MIEKMRQHDGRGRAPAASNGRGAEPHDDTRALRLLAAQTLLVSGIVSTLEGLGRAREDLPHRHRDHPLDFARDSGPLGAVTSLWAPALLTPIAALAHVMRRPDASAATRILDVAVVGAGLLGLAGAIVDNRRRGGMPSLTPVLVASAGVLGLMLDREEQRWLQERERLKRRASVVARLVPRRRARLDRIVLHV